MKLHFLFCIVVLASACSSTQNAPQPASAETTSTTQDTCIGNTELPIGYWNQFEAVDDPELLASALGQPDTGGLCKGRVFQAKDDAQVTLYRAWNSTNPNSEMGKWWAWQAPTGAVAQYREDYEICYQWSPLDKLVACELKPGAKIVIGPGQSAKCSQYLSYASSATQQVYIENAASAVTECQRYNSVFSWQ